MSERAGGKGAFDLALLAPRVAVLGLNPCGGSEVVLWEDWEIFQQAGIPARVYASAAVNGARVQTLRVRTSLPLITSLEYCGRWLRKEPRSLLLAYNEPTVAGLAPDRSIIRFDWATPLPRYWRLPGWLPRFLRSLYLFPSESSRADFLEQHKPIPHERTAVIPNAVDLTFFRPAGHKQQGLRVGFGGQWVPQKGLFVLLQAWDLVRDREPGAELILAGGRQLWRTDGEVAGAAEVAARVERAQAQGVVRVAGEIRREDMADFWNSVDIGVLPSLYESFGLSALEAMACGVAVVASDVGGLAEIITNRENGLLVPPNQPERLAEALISLLANADRRAALGAHARRRAEAFSIKRRARELLLLVENRRREQAERAPVGKAGDPGERDQLPPATEKAR